MSIRRFAWAGSLGGATLGALVGCNYQQNYNFDGQVPADRVVDGRVEAEGDARVEAPSTEASADAAHPDERAATSPTPTP